MLIPPFFIDCVVAIGNTRLVPHAAGQATRVEWDTSGTGFFYGYLVKPDEDPTKREYLVCLVTAKHIVETRMKNALDIRCRLNSKEVNQPVQDFELPKQTGASQWFFHPNPNIDVAVVAVNLDFLKSHQIEPHFFAGDLVTADRAKLKGLEVAAGDGIFVLGFPMGLTGEQRNYVIVRQGCIARISDMLDGATRDFMIDAAIFPGNSGGPVVLKPEAIAIEGTKNQSNATLLGLVSSYLPYQDVAVSQQTGLVRVIFQENSGLAAVLPIDFINETIAAPPRSPRSRGASWR